MTSFRARMFRFSLKVFRAKYKCRKLFINPSRTKKDFVPKKIQNLFNVEVQNVNSKVVATIESKQMVTNTHVIFLHGGAYVLEITPFHWRTAINIVNKIFCRMSLIDYPLAPENNYVDTFEMISNTYDILTKKYKNDKFILLGDSAGGGLAFAFSQKLIKDNFPVLPLKNVLISPWLDITMTNPDISKTDKVDHFLCIDTLKFVGGVYANGDDQHQYLLSPINGDLNNLPDTAVFYGTHENFFADCAKLKKMVKNLNTHFKFYEYKKMQHDWAMFPIPEAKKAINEICEFLEN